jgi:hypothetical protein
LSNTIPTSKLSEAQPDSALVQTTRLLARLGRDRFYGKLTLSFEAGNIVSLRKEETLKPADLAR